MAKQSETRRDALRKIVGTMAAAAALSGSQIEELLAQVKAAPNLARLGSVRTSSNAVKALKVMLAPAGQAARVFESEFGRRPAVKPSLDAKTGKETCPAFMGAGGSCADLGCSLVVCNGLTMGDKLQLVAEVSQKTQGRTNAASTDCERGFDRTDSCNGYVPPTVGFRTVKIQPEWLESQLKDPYIQGLMREFGVNNAKDLAAQLDQTLADRRMGR